LQQDQRFKASQLAEYNKGFRQDECRQHDAPSGRSCFFGIYDRLQVVPNQIQTAVCTLYGKLNKNERAELLPSRRTNFCNTSFRVKVFDCVAQDPNIIVVNSITRVLEQCLANGSNQHTPTR